MRRHGGRMHQDTMYSPRELKDREYIPQRTYLKLMIGGTLSLLKTLTLNLGTLKKLRNNDSTDIYVRPERPYDIPAYSQDMEHHVSDEKYLRPTLYCNPRHPDIVAMAHELGASRLSERAYAEAAFEFVKRNVTLEILPLDGAEDTLRRGTGTCFHQISLFIALCRAAGVKARYKMFAMNLIDAWYDAVVEVDPLIKKWYDSMGYFMIEGEGEAHVDGEWVVAHVGPKPERQAAAHIPVTKFGEDSLGRWFHALPGTIMRMESIPYGLGGATRILKKIAPGSMARVNQSILQQIAHGHQIIEQAGGEEAYDRQARQKSAPEMPKVSIQRHKAVTFAH